MIDRLTIDKIFNTVDIVDVVGEFVSLKRRGANFLGLCPFHNEKTPSFTVSPTKGIYKCFGCGKGGNSVNFIMEHEGLDYVGALKFLAKKYNIEIEEKELTAEQIKNKDRRQSLLILTQNATEWFKKQLHETIEGKNIGLSYFTERGFSKETINTFQLGYSPRQRDALTKHALFNGFKIDLLNDSGLTITKDNRNFDRFSDRVIFPIQTISGQVIGFGGRILSNEKKKAKYLNSPESELYHKSKTLYGIYQARKAITEQNYCILVEGYTDVISLHQAEVKNVVASSGTSLTPDQVKLIKRFSNNLTVLYDGDSAGIKASLRGIDIILEQEINIKVCLLPDGEDPDSFARKNGNTAIQQFIKSNAIDFIKFKTKLLLNQASDDPTKKTEVISSIVKSISLISNSISRSIYIKECSTMLDINESVLYQEINKLRHKDRQQEYFKERKTTVPQPKQLTPKTENVLTQLEEEIIWLILQYGNEELELTNVEDEEDNKTISVASFIIEDLLHDELHFSNPLMRKILDELINMNKQSEEIDQKYFFNNEDAEIVTTTINIVEKEYPLSKIWERNLGHSASQDFDLSAIIERMLLEYKSRQVINIIKELINKINSVDSEERKELMKEINRLNNLKGLFAQKLNNRFLL